MTAKIQLSPAEMQLMCDAEVILTKNSVLQKTTALLQAVQQRQLQSQKDFEAFLPGTVFSTPPKIARGENYEGLPWLMLDYPRLFTPTDTFAIRTFFWWGRYFSCTLQLSGVYKLQYTQTLQKAFDKLAPQHYVGMNPDPWQHHFEKDNYRPVAQMHQKEFEAFAAAQPHIKLATVVPLTQWHEADSLLFNHWQFYLSLLMA